MVHAILRAWGHNSGQYLCLWRQEGKRDRLPGLDPEKGLTFGGSLDPHPYLDVGHRTLGLSLEQAAAARTENVHR